MKPKSKSTLRNYDACWYRWVGWCRAFHRDPIGNLNAETVSRFLTYLSDASYRCAYIELHLASLVAKGKTTSTPLVTSGLKDLLKDLRRAEKDVDQKLPISENDLLEGLPTGHRPSDLRDRALLLVGFSGELRRADLSALRWEGVTWSSGAVLFQYLIQGTEGNAAIRVIYQEDLMAEKALHAWYESEGTPKTGYVFHGLDRIRSDIPMDGGSIARVVKKAMERAGLDPTRYSVRSLRSRSTGSDQ